MELMAFQTMRESEILRECEESHSGGWVLCPRKVLASEVAALSHLYFSFFLTSLYSGHRFSVYQVSW